MRIYIIKESFKATTKGIQMEVDEDILSTNYTNYKDAYNAMKSLVYKHFENGNYRLEGLERQEDSDNAVAILEKKSEDGKRTYQIKVEIVTVEV